MFDNKTRSEIDRKYFDIIEFTCNYFVIRSKCTGHYWKVLYRESNGFRSHLVSHKHHKEDSFHDQTCCGSMKKIQEYIRRHDDYHLKRIKKKESGKRFRK